MSFSGDVLSYVGVKLGLSHTEGVLEQGAEENIWT